jgi:hypothetical protein
MIAYIFAWIAHNWPTLLIWMTVAAALTCCVVGGYLTWREWRLREVEASE